MKILGALLAGGESRRFGSDKAMARFAGQYLIDHALGLLNHQCDEIIICGREYRDYDHIMDRPANAGPLGALNAALLHARDAGYDAVISFPCDTIMQDTSISIVQSAWFKHDRGAQYMTSQPVIGYWPNDLAGTLDQWLSGQDRRAMMAWTEYCGAIAVDSAMIFKNINKRSDMPL